MRLSDLLSRISIGRRRHESEEAMRAALLAVFGPDFRWQAAGQCAISETGRFLYNRIPKNANSSLISLLHAIDKGRFRSVIKSRNNMKHLNRISVKEIGRIAEYKRMVVIRNPYSRLLSAFLEKFSYDHMRERYGAFDLTPAGFGDFVSYLEHGGLDKNNHWDLQTKRMILPPDQYTDVIRFESLRGQMEAFLVSAGVPHGGKLLDAIGARSFAGRRHGTGSTDKVGRFYTAERAERVFELYRSDFEALGYPREAEGPSARSGTAGPDMPPG